MNALFSRIEIKDETGVLLARQQARMISELLGFHARDRVAIASSVTHAACEAVRHAGGALVEYELETEAESAAPSLLIRVVDRASADCDLDPGHPRDFEPASRWMDRFDVEKCEGRPTIVTISRRIAERRLPLDPSLVSQIAEELLGFHPVSPIGELLDQDLALFRSFEAIQGRENELRRLHGELEEAGKTLRTLRVEQGEWLRSAHDQKTRFIPRVSHELRTPLASILGLARLLLGRADGELSLEQERQVSFILRAGHELSGLVNDLLDLARMEAGRETLHLSEVRITDFLASIEAKLRPMAPPGSAVALVFEDPGELPTLWTDEEKLGQILRNFLTNALKFTERGEIRVKVSPGPDETVNFSVIDTGLGIAPENLERVFEEFGQVEGPHQPLVKGTGLGLPLARKIAGLLGGRVDLRSEPGIGSTFVATIPIRLSGNSAEDCPIVP